MNKLTEKVLKRTDETVKPLITKDDLVTSYADQATGILEISNIVPNVAMSIAAQEKEKDEQSKSFKGLKHKSFDDVLKAFYYLNGGEQEDEPDFSLFDVSRAAIDIFNDMRAYSIDTVCGIKYKDEWSKEDLAEFISELFETLLDFLDSAPNNISESH